MSLFHIFRKNKHVCNRQVVAIKYPVYLKEWIRYSDSCGNPGKYTLKIGSKVLRRCSECGIETVQDVDGKAVEWEGHIVSEPTSEEGK